MARYHYIIFLGVLLFLSACGQVGEITGGEEDKTAPQVLLDKVNPPMSSLNSKPEKITLPFDEFITLNKPTENIRVAPADVTLAYEVKKKSLVLTVKEGEWQDNTTYTIYLNRAVKDITEGNDSIMSYVFSTGSFIDSMHTAIQVKDAYTGRVAENITVGLYNAPLTDDTSKVNPRYLSLTDKNGIASFQHIKKDTFYIYAFDDENRNNRLDATEKRAYLKNAVVLYDNDTVEIIGPIIRLMPPEEKELKIKSNEFIAPGTWGIRFNRPLLDTEKFQPLTVNQEKFEEQYATWNKEGDSIVLFFEATENAGDLSAILQTEETTDTIAKKYFFRQKPDLKISNNIKGGRLNFTNQLTLTASEPIIDIDSLHIDFSYLEKNDSVEKPQNYTIEVLSAQEIRIDFERKNQDKLFLKIGPQALKGLNTSLRDSIKLDFGLQTERETGTMIITFDSIPPYGVLTVINKQTKEEIDIVFDGIEKQTHTLKSIQPNQYEFRFLIDKDKNGKWSTGNIFDHKEAEQMIFFQNLTTIRANWDVKTTLEISALLKEN